MLNKGIQKGNGRLITSLVDIICQKGGEKSNAMNVNLILLIMVSLN